MQYIGQNSKKLLGIVAVAFLCAFFSYVERAGAADFQPGYPVYVNSFLSPFGTPPAPVELLGLDLAVKGEAITGTPIRYQEGAKLGFRFYWEPRQAPEGLSAVLTLTGSGPRISSEYELPVGGWETGVVRQQEVEFLHPRGKYSGSGTFTLSLRSSVDSQEYILWRCPCQIEAATFASKVGEAELRKVFGEDIVPLRKSFRLGTGAKVVVPLPRLSGSFAGVAIISATGFDGRPERGRAVCRVEGVVDQETCSMELRTAYTTAPSEDYRLLEVARAEDRLQKFSSFKSGDVTVSDYIGFMPFPKSGLPRSLTFEYLDNIGVMDVKEVVLLRHAP